MSGLPRPALGNNGQQQRTSQLNESSSNNISDTSNLSEASTTTTNTPKSRQRIQNDTSLGATAKRFVNLMTGACDQVF